jgi:site-specific DNA recombinase
MTKSPKAQAPRIVRCAVYTRKSTEEGLEQEFNSLHAQRESAEGLYQEPEASGLGLLACALRRWRLHRR